MMSEKNKGETKVCKYCQTEISKKAKVCPSCRKKQGPKKGLIALLVIIILIIIIAVAASSGNSNEPSKVGEVENTGGSETGNTTSDQQDVTDSADDGETVFKVGEIAELNGVKVTMTDFEESEGDADAFLEPSEGNVFVIAEFEIENNSDNDINVSSMLSFEAYADDYSLNYSLSAGLLKDSALDGTIASGKKMKGWIGWEVPEDYSNVEIHFTDDVWTNNKFVFLYEK